MTFTRFHLLLISLAIPVMLVFIISEDQSIMPSEIRPLLTRLDPVKLDTEQNRFTKTVLIEKMDEPLQLAIVDADRVLYIERKGKIWLYDHTIKKKKLVTTIPVSTKYTDKAGKISEAEDGLLGIALDPGFAVNSFIYLYYSPAGTAPKNVLARYLYKNGQLIAASKKIILEIPVQREECCHTGGGMAFDRDGNLYLSTGDNTSPRSTPYSPIDEREGRGPWDAQKSSANTNDLRGKIIRIHPLPNGSYTIPEGNLFAKDMPGTKPEIYVMGTRNPYRISVDKKTGFLYWGDVGPDSGKDSSGLGPKSFDEFNQAKEAGFYGWPYFVGNNQSYWKFDFSSNTSGEKFDPEKPANYSPNNTGLKELPPAQKPLIWYSYEPTREFPLVGTGGRSAMAGPVFYADDFVNAKRRFPDYYNGKLFIYEWMRDWIMTVSLNAEGKYISMQRFLPDMAFTHPMDMQFSPAGDLFIIEYGTGWFQGNDDARLVKIEYNAGNRKPEVKAAADKPAGALPFKVNFSSAGSRDADGDTVKFQWQITTSAGVLIKTFNEPDPEISFTKPGIYTAVLTGTDRFGAKSTAKLLLKAGNEPPDININITRGNSTYYFKDVPVEYDVEVKDKEDGLPDKGISRNSIKVGIIYNGEYSISNAAETKNNTAIPSTFAEGQRLIGQSDCKACHAAEKKVIGPSYLSIAQKYRENKNALTLLSEKVINGGTGVWGDVPMAAHPQLSKKDVNEMIRYILSSGKKADKAVFLPLKGSINPPVPDSAADNSAVIISAVYTDKGAPGSAPITTEKKWVLKNPKLVPGSVWKINGLQKFKLPDPPMEMFVVMSNGSWAAYEQVDLNGITKISFAGAAPKEQLNSAGGIIEVRLDSPEGELIGETVFMNPFPGPITELKPEVLSASIRQVTGRHNLYFVFRNPKAAGPLFLIFSAKLELK